MSDTGPGNGVSITSVTIYSVMIGFEYFHGMDKADHKPA